MSAPSKSSIDSCSPMARPETMIPPGEYLQRELKALEDVRGILGEEKYDKAKQIAIDRFHSTYAWYLQYVQLADELDRIREAYTKENRWEILKERIVERHNRGSLAPIEVLLLSQLVLNDNKEWGAFLVSHLMLTTPPDKVYGVHNVDCLQKMGPAERRGYAPVVMRLTGTAIFPPHRVTDLNGDLLRGRSAAPFVGGNYEPYGCFTAPRERGAPPGSDPGARQQRRGPHRPQRAGGAPGKPPTDQWDAPRQNPRHPEAGGE